MFAEPVANMCTGDFLSGLLIGLERHTMMVATDPQMLFVFAAHGIKALFDFLWKGALIAGVFY